MRTKLRQALVRALQKEDSITDRVMRQQFWVPEVASPNHITPLLKLR